ncbi:MAG: recombinase family protein [Huintestinicola sp.]
MKIAYVRVSTIEQNEARQIEALEKFGTEKSGYHFESARE